MPDLEPVLLRVKPAGLDARRSLGWQVADWCETMLCHGPGDVEGDPLEWDEELRAFIVMAYAVDRRGRRLVMDAVLSRAKGRAKSELAGALVCAEALGPVRFDHWAAAGETAWWGYEFEEGEPVGRPVTAPFIRCLATEEGQTGNTYDNVRMMLTDGAIAHHVNGLDVGLTRTFLPGSGEIRPSTAGAASKDGGKETFSVADEVHLYVLPEHRRMYDTVSRNSRKRKQAQPWMLSTTTMYEPGQRSVGESLHQYALSVQAGEVKNRRLLFDHREAPPACIEGDRREGEFLWTSDRELRAALACAYGPAAKWLPLDDMVAEIRKPTTSINDALRYFCNQARSAQGDAVDLKQWAALKGAAPLQDGDTICLGFDGSDSGDATGLVAVRASDRSWHKLGLWEQPDLPHGTGWRVPRSEVRAAVDEAFRRYRVIRFYADPPYWHTELDEWTVLYGDNHVAAWYSSSSKRISKATDRFDTDLRAGELAHTDDPDIARHLGNARREKCPGGWRPAKKGHRRFIDLFLAGLAAMEALGDATAAGELDAVEESEAIALVL